MRIGNRRAGSTPQWLRVFSQFASFPIELTEVTT